MLTLSASGTIAADADVGSVLTYSIFGMTLVSSVEAYGVLAQGQAAASAATVYTAPNPGQAFIKTISVVNTDTLSHTIQWFANGTAAAQAITPTLTIPPGGLGQYEDGQGWQFYNSSGVLLTGQYGPIDVQSFLGTGTQTWTKPTAWTPKFVRVVAYGAGGGGGGGASNTGGVVRTGGAGGGGGARAECLYLASDLGATETLTVGSGVGRGGAGGASGASGTTGTPGGNTTFSSGIHVLTAFGGGGGSNGNISALANAGGSGGGIASAGANGTGSAATGGAPGAPATPNGGCGANSLATAGTPVCAEYGGAAGGGCTNVPANGVGGGSMFGGAGGGHGTGSSVTPALVAGTAGGGHVNAGGGGGAVGSDGAAPTAGTGGTGGGIYVGGFGGGGGGGTISANTTGANGGAGGQPGGGGGGGGVGSNTGLGGSGGDGGNGAIYIVSW